MNTAAFFDCVFLGCPNELVGDEPYVIYADDKAHPFAETLIRACRGDAAYLGLVRDLSKLPDDAVVICEGPVWNRQFEALRSVGVKGFRARVLLYFDRDASSFWDFAMACGEDLAEIFRNGVDAGSIKLLSPFLEQWTGGRISNGRIMSLARFYTRDFMPLQVENGAAIARVMAAMADDESRQTYARILFGTSEEVFQEFTRAVFGVQQYMDIVKLDPGDVVINCGVGRGWEIPFFLTKLKGRGWIHNMDPNQSFASNPYRDFIERFRPMMTEHLLIVSDNDGRIRLNIKEAGMITSDTTLAAESLGGDVEEFECRSIDSLMADGMAERVDYLKMDVEGGELAILRGAVQTIRKHRPKLAVAIYHEPHHFWEYPSFILDHFDDYRLYLRQYGYSRFETLLYAIPKESVSSRSGQEGLRGARAEKADDHRPQLLLHMREKESHGADTHTPERRSLARVFGADWAVAQIEPAPWVEADTLFGVVEQKSSSLFFTSHMPDDSQSQIVVGESSGKAEIEWLASFGAPARAVCILLAPTGLEYELLAWDRQAGVCDIIVFGEHQRATRLMSKLWSFPLKDEPVLGWREEGEVVLVCRSDRAQELLSVRVREGEEAQVERFKAPRGELAGAVMVRDYPDGVTRNRLGYAMITAGGERLDVYADQSGALQQAGAIDFDPRFTLAPTYVAAETGKA